MGAGTEFLVEGHSSDDTYAAIERAIAANPDRTRSLLRQTGRGKGRRRALGFADATGDILMILDADLTVPPEDLPRFYEALIRDGKGDFMQRRAPGLPDGRTRHALPNLLGNKFFSLAFPGCSDSRSRTRSAAPRSCAATHTRRSPPTAPTSATSIRSAISISSSAPPSSTSRLSTCPSAIASGPTATTNIQRWRHGWLLLKMCVFAAGRIKFV